MIELPQHQKHDFIQVSQPACVPLLSDCTACMYLLGIGCTTIVGISSMMLSGFPECLMEDRSACVGARVI